MVAVRDFNAKPISWYANENTNIEGTEIENLTSSFEFNQTINEIILLLVLT